MIDILFLLDFEPGHVFPTFRMGHNLVDNGFRIAFLGVSGVLDDVAKEGFETHTIFDDQFSKEVMASIQKRGEQSSAPQKSNKDLSALLKGELDELMLRLNPRLIIASDFMPLEALLLYYKYDVPLAFYSSTLHDEQKMSALPNFSYPKLGCHVCRNKIHQSDMDFTMELLDFFEGKKMEFKNYEEMVAPILNMPHLIICPEELKISSRPLHPMEIHIGPGIRFSPKEHEELVTQILPTNDDKPIIYAAMGSIPSVFPKKAEAFFRLIVDCMQEDSLRDFHLILSTSGFLKDSDFEHVPTNVSIVNWVPQVALLEKVDMAVFHGGLGSLKECCYFGVPMLVVPMVNDQFVNAKRVAHHQIGSCITETPLTKAKMIEGILKVRNDIQIRNGIDTMKTKFQEAENAQKEVAIIQSYLATVEQKMAKSKED